MGNPLNEGGRIPVAVESGWDVSVAIGGGHPSYRLLFYPDPADVRFQHQCDRGKRGVIVCAPRLTKVNQAGGHQITGPRHEPTVRASIACEDCGTHGFITDGQWAAC